MIVICGLRQLTWDTILLVAVVLSDTMPMKASTFGRQLVVHGDLKSITPVGVDRL